MNTYRSLPRRAALAATATAAALVLAACGSDAGSSDASDNNSSPSADASEPASKHNDTDITFAKEMILHHRQAIEMAELAGARAASSDVKKLAEDIEKAQDPEIRTMSGWLKSWGEEVPEEGSMDHGDMGHGNGSDMSEMPGMMDEAQMKQLEKGSGKAFDTAFLTMMIEHHEGALEMAETEKKEGSYGPAKKLADDVIKDQTAEINTMRKMLGKS